MIIVNNKISDVVYLTASTKSEDCFNKFMAHFKQNECLSNPFRLHTKVISSPSILMSEISSYTKIKDKYGRWIYVILDYTSFVDWDNETTELTEQYRAVVRALVLLYPEIQFFFDETATLKREEGLALYPHFLDIAELQNDDYILQMDAHIFDASKCKEKFSEILGTENLFDASNLRYFLKLKKYDDLHVRTRNFKKLQDSRAKNLAICVEEERSQNLFNSYAAYASGYRAATIASSCALKKANGDFVKDENAKTIILRDYDLQFADQPTDIGGEEKEIYQIRGWKIIENKNKSLQVKCLMTPDNKYWGNFVKNNIDICYITKGGLALDVSLLKNTDDSNSDEKRDKVHLYGIHKPVSGLYYPMCCIEPIGNTYENSRDKDEIEKRRSEGGHGVPLDIYNWVKDMVNRAGSYYKAHRYIHSAVLCQEAMELMNGFHTALMIKAYSIKAIAENAIAADILGGSEKQLCEDIKKRISYITQDVARLLGDDQKEHSKNVLNQIFSDCRNFCKEKELFSAEDLFIGAMGHMSERYSLAEIKSDLATLKELFKKPSSNQN